MDRYAARFPAKTKPWFVIGESFPPKTPEEEEEGFWMVGCRKNNNPKVFAGCKKSPGTVTREGGVSAPDWRREQKHAQKKGAERTESDEE